MGLGTELRDDLGGYKAYSLAHDDTSEALADHGPAHRAIYSGFLQIGGSFGNPRWTCRPADRFPRVRRARAARGVGRDRRARRRRRGAVRAGPNAVASKPLQLRPVLGPPRTVLPRSNAQARFSDPIRTGLRGGGAVRDTGVPLRGKR